MIKSRFLSDYDKYKKSKHIKDKLQPEYLIPRICIAFFNFIKKGFGKIRDKKTRSKFIEKILYEVNK